jgi:3-hydroxybutyrate dehydrogenase
MRRSDVSELESVDGEVALVTGAAGGIGAAICARLSEAGVRVVAADLAPDGSGPGLPVAVDLTTRAGNRAAVDAALDTYGRLDIVVANAGFQHVSPIEEFPEDRWDALLAILLTSPFLLARYAWPALRDAPAGGRFLAVASVHGTGRVAVQGRVRRGEARRRRSGEDPGARRRRPRHPRRRAVPRLRPDPAGRGADLGAGAGSQSPEADVLEQVILAPHAVKRLIETDEVAETAAFLLGPAGARSPAPP